MRSPAISVSTAALFYGVGTGVSPRTALTVGLKVDVDALPLAVKNAIAAGQVGLDSCSTARPSSPTDGAARSKGGYYQDGRFATLQDVVQDYDQAFAPGLAPAQKADVVQFVQSL